MLFICLLVCLPFLDSYPLPLAFLFRPFSCARFFLSVCLPLRLVMTLLAFPILMTAMAQGQRTSTFCLFLSNHFVTCNYISEYCLATSFWLSFFLLCTLASFGISFPVDVRFYVCCCSFQSLIFSSRFASSYFRFDIFVLTIFVSHFFFFFLILSVCSVVRIRRALLPFHLSILPISLMPVFVTCWFGLNSAVAMVFMFTAKRVVPTLFLLC